MARTIFPCVSSSGWERPSTSPKPSRASQLRPWRGKKRDLEQQLTVLLAATTGCDLAQQLQAKIGRVKNQLLTFCDYSGEVDVTNNTFERKLRPCVIQRKVTNGYRAMWAEPARGSGTRSVLEWQAEGAEAEADVRTTIDTAKLIGDNPFNVIVGTLA